MRALDEFLNIPAVGQSVKKALSMLIRPSLRQLIVRSALGTPRVRFADPRP